jgi:hypothetical protein
MLAGDLSLLRLRRLSNRARRSFEPLILPRFGGHRC